MFHFFFVFRLWFIVSKLDENEGIQLASVLTLARGQFRVAPTSRLWNNSRIKKTKKQKKTKTGQFWRQFSFSSIWLHFRLKAEVAVK